MLFSLAVQPYTRDQVPAPAECNTALVYNSSESLYRDNEAMRRLLKLSNFLSDLMLLKYSTVYVLA